MTQNDTRSFRNEQLVLRVSEAVDPRIWDESKYEGFLELLCGNRQYQRDAIQTALRYMQSGRYQNVRQLAEENFASSDDLKARYGSLEQMQARLLFPDKLYCTLDLATGTGKSYVLYGMAMILLAEGVVDRVLVLCPSNTIEKGLCEKFTQLSGDGELADSLPACSALKVPKIIRADRSVTATCICVENYHAVLEHVKSSSIRETLKGNGQNTLVLIDEVHHAASEPEDSRKRLSQFLDDPNYGFVRMAGVSGTCYIGDEYFADVVTRYSLSKAIEQGFVKDIEYVDEADIGRDPSERLQIILQNHQRNRKTYRKVKPLTIIVTKNITACEQAAEEWIDFLCEFEKLDRKAAEEKVLVVTSSKKHAPNLAKLAIVDSKKDSKVEWIFSVSMLSEGWDVKNVFQIVPHEERAFNSKLLISQVLGRGLRLPEGYTAKECVVTVFNHQAWSNRIRHLVEEILEIEKRLYCRPDPAKAELHFCIHQIDYSREPGAQVYKQEGQYELLKKGFVLLPSQVDSFNREIEYERGVSREHITRTSNVKVKMYTVEEVASVVYERLRAIDMENAAEGSPTDYAKKHNFEWCKAMVEESMKRCGEKNRRVSDENRQKILQALGPLLRGAAKAVRYRPVPKNVFTVSTKDRPANSVALSTLHDGEVTVFYAENSGRVLKGDEVVVFEEAVSEDSDLPRRATVHIENEFCFKTPLNVVLADRDPERKFIRRITEQQNSQAIDSWVKSTDRDFYPIEYSWKKGEHTKRGTFNPDFFIKKGSTIYVIEVKDDTQIKDPDEENKKKYEFAKAHFDLLNQQQDELRYQFHFLTPEDYDAFFQKLRSDQLEGYQSHLDVALTA